MNKLKGLSSYLVGNIDGVRHSSATGWRNEMSLFLKDLNVLVFDPINKPLKQFVENEDFRKKRKEALDNEDYDTVSAMMKPTRSLDLRFVDKADFLVCNIDMDGRPFGSIEEIVTANRQKKPVIIHCPQGKKKLPPWAFGMLPHELFFSTWKEVYTYIYQVDQGIDTRDFGRWWFIDYDTLIQGTSLGETTSGKIQ